MKYNVKVTIEYKISIPDPKTLPIKLAASNLPASLKEFDITAIEIKEIGEC